MWQKVKCFFGFHEPKRYEKECRDFCFITYFCTECHEVLCRRVVTSEGLFEMRSMF